MLEDSPLLLVLWSAFAQVLEALPLRPHLPLAVGQMHSGHLDLKCCLCCSCAYYRLMRYSCGIGPQLNMRLLECKAWQNASECSLLKGARIA